MRGNRLHFAINYLLERPVKSFMVVCAIDMFAFYVYYRNHREQTSKMLSEKLSEAFNVNVPKVLRSPVYTAYAWFYGVNLGEVQQPLQSYQKLGDFFSRKVNARPIDPSPHSVVVPADSRVLSISEISSDSSLIVKSLHYSLGEFLTGYPIRLTGEELAALKRNPENSLYQVILYLAPGDYHRFHSPADFEVVNREKLGGSLFPVNEKCLLREKNKVYEKNYRVILEGRYWGGYMMMGMVGAFNVGSISIHPASSFKKGEEVGMFSLGSTIIMIFEAPKGHKLKISEGQKVRYADLMF